MTHYKVEIQIPLYYNPKGRKKKRRKISKQLFYRTYEELFDLAGGIHTTNIPVLGAWKCPKTGRKFYDRCIVYIVLVETEDKMTITNIPKIQELVKYKKVIKKKI